MPIFIVISQASDQHEATIHNYATNGTIAKYALEELAHSRYQAHLLNKKLIQPGEIVQSPLRDTISLDNINTGATIRFKDKEETIIELIEIEKIRNYILFAERVRTVIETFKIVQVEAICKEVSIEKLSNEAQYVSARPKDEIRDSDDDEEEDDDDSEDEENDTLVH